MHSDINDSLNTLVYRTNIILKGKLQTYLKDFDITSEQWAVLTRLLQKDGYNQKELSIDSFKEQAAITRTLDILENKGLVERKKSLADRREFLIYITEKGKNLLKETSESTLQYYELLNSVLEKEEMENLKLLLNKLCKRLSP